MSLTDAMLILAVAIVVSAVIVSASLDSLRKSIVDSLHSILSELEWQQGGTGTKMQRRIEERRIEAEEMESELPGMAALGLLPHQPLGKMRLAEVEKERMAAEERERLATSEKQRLAAEEKDRQRMGSLSWRLGRFVRLWRLGR